jgi:hypothetical protein
MCCVPDNCCLLSTLAAAAAAAAVICRPDFMTNFVDNLVDWAAVAKRFEAATA